MRRHEPDWVSFAAGVLALAAGGGYLLARAYDISVDPLPALGLLLLLAGVLGLVLSVLQLTGVTRRRDR